MDSKFPLWCMRVSRLLELYDCKEGAVLEPHHVLKARKDVVRIQRRKNAKIIFVSHEWCDYNHPDPTGTQLKHLCAILKRLGRGEVENVTTDWRTRIWIKDSMNTSPEEWKSMVDLKESYVWIDYVSMPQPTAVLRESNVSTYKDISQTNIGALLSASEKLMLAAESMESYVSACSFMLVLTPDVFVDKSQFVRYGKPERPSLYSWRTRGWCMLELLACVLSEEPKRVLIVRNGISGIPSWYCSAAATFGIQVGLRDFTCCKCNHKFSRRGIVPCDKIVVSKILTKMLSRTIKFQFSNGNSQMARWLLCASHIFFAGLPWKNEWEDLDRATSICIEDEVERFKKSLQWKPEDEKASESSGISLLKYAIIARNNVVVKYFIDKILKETEPNSTERAQRLSEPTKKPMFHTIRTVGVTHLMAAMAFSNSSIVQILLDAGATPSGYGHVARADAWFYGTFFRRVDNFLLLRAKFPDRDLNNRLLGGFTGLIGGVLVTPGAQRETVQMLRVLIASGIDTTVQGACGFTDLMTATLGFDVNKDTMEILLIAMREKNPDAINFRITPQSTFGSLIHIAAKIMTSGPISKWWNLNPILKNGMLRNLLGCTALHLAFMTGNCGLADLLLKYGADLYILNDEGLSVLDVAQSTGHEEVMRLFLKSYCEKNGMQMPPTKLSIESSNEKKKEKNGNGHSSEEKVPSTRQDMRRSRADVMQENLKRARFREEKRERLREEKRARLSEK